jgi:hypothetical protein
MAKQIYRRLLPTSFAAFIVAACLTSPAAAQSAEEFFRGKKELNLVTSSAVGGGYDSYSRLIAHHMSRYLPGNPTIVVQNMLGGGGIRATNYIYNVAPRDGTVFALIDRGMPTAPLLYADKSQARLCENSCLSHYTLNLTTNPLDLLQRLRMHRHRIDPGAAPRRQREQSG